MLGRGSHTDGGVRANGVEPVHPLGGGDLDGVEGACPCCLDTLIPAFGSGRAR